MELSIFYATLVVILCCLHLGFPWLVDELSIAAEHLTLKSKMRLPLFMLHCYIFGNVEHITISWLSNIEKKILDSEKLC